MPNRFAIFMDIRMATPESVDDPVFISFMKKNPSDAGDLRTPVVYGENG